MGGANPKFRWGVNLFFGKIFMKTAFKNEDFGLGVDGLVRGLRIVPPRDRFRILCRRGCQPSRWVPIYHFAKLYKKNCIKFRNSCLYGGDTYRGHPFRPPLPPQPNLFIFIHFLVITVFFFAITTQGGIRDAHPLPTVK